MLGKFDKDDTHNKTQQNKHIESIDESGATAEEKKTEAGAANGNHEHNPPRQDLSKDHDDEGVLDDITESVLELNLLNDEDSIQFIQISIYSGLPSQAK